MANNLEILNAGVPAGETAIAKFEAFIGCKLPKEYRDFLTQYDGGSPEPDTIAVGANLTDVQTFFELRESDSSAWIYWNLELFREQYPGSKLIPIACDSGGGRFCLHSDTGAIHYIAWADPEPHVWFVSESFGTMLSALQ